MWESEGGNCPLFFLPYLSRLGNLPQQRPTSSHISLHLSKKKQTHTPESMKTDEQNSKEGQSKKTAPTEQKGGSTGEEKKGKKGKEGAARDEDGHKCSGCRFPLLIAGLQLLLGIAITAVAFVMRSISSSLLLRDTPYWVGIIICLTALLGFYMYCITYEVDEQTARQFIAKLIYFLLCTLGLILSISAIAFAGHHYNQITKFTCQMNSEHCVCKQDLEDQIARSFQYNDVPDCESITSTIKLYLLLQMVLNLCLALVCLLGCYVMWKHRYQVFFAGLRLHPFKTTSQQQQKV